MLSVGEKIRGSRAVLNLTRSEMAEQCFTSPALLQRAEADDRTVSEARIKVFLTYLEDRGFSFTEKSITFDKGAGKAENVQKKSRPLDNEEIYKALKGDDDFVRCFSKWPENIKERFFRTVRALNKAGLDLWYVDMGGEIRAGAKPIDGEKGKPFAFMRLEEAGFTFDWHGGITSYVNYISNFPASFGHKVMVADQFVNDLVVAVNNGAEIPPLLKSLANGRLPSAYPRKVKK